MQVLSIQLNQICAMNQLRNRVSQSCLLGCVGEINAGKTSLVRALLSLPQEPDGHKPENATRCAAASPMPVPGSEGLQTTQASPLLVDTPGMFDADTLWLTALFATLVIATSSAHASLLLLCLVLGLLGINAASTVQPQVN